VRDAEAAEAAERWFVDHGLPYFVDDIREDARAHLSRPRLVVVGVVALVLGVAAAGVLLGVGGDASLGVATGLTVVILVGLGYAARALKAWMITRWALRRTFGSLGLLFPLATRALPMLLLFVTFLFINTEVWQVASSLHGGVLWGTVLVFGVTAVGFLLVRLDEELDLFDDEITPEDLVAHCAGTPLEAAARSVAASGADPSAYAEVTGLQKANLVLMLLVAQAVQVLLLALAVFAFFLVFGAVAVDDSVIRSWIGDDPHYPLHLDLVSLELTKVSVFLAAFSGLYFTVYAVTDAAYRKQFFTAIMRELGQVVTARVVYRNLKG